MNQAFLQQAIDLSRETMAADEGGPFAALIVKDGKILARGWNRVSSACDPTAHGEIEAIRKACQQLQSFSLQGCELYSSCEPCPMCLAACYWAGLEQVYYAASRQDASAAGFDDHDIALQLGKAPCEQRLPMQQALQDKAQAVFAEWLQKEDRIPY